MKIAVITSWFSENMGYSENFFPKALASLGHDVHVISSTAQVYFNSPIYDKTYRKHLGPAITQPCVKTVDGFTLHRLAFTEQKYSAINPFHFSGIRIHELYEYLRRLQPDVIQVVNLIDEPTTYDAALYARSVGKKIFTESHLHASVMRVNNRRSWKERLRAVVYRFHTRLSVVNDMTAICYPIAPDAAEIVESLYHVKKEKIKIQPLGVDTDLFCPPHSPALADEREALRRSLGFGTDEIVCIYTGRFSPGKNPQLLADAIDILQKKGEKIRGLFLGNGTESEVENIRNKQGCLVHPFVTVLELPKFYRSADIGVWPREESTSQLDAAACGVPIIISNRVHVTERVDGNGLLYNEGDANDLAEKIMQMKSPSLRRQFSAVGVDKVFRKFSWKTLAAQRIDDYVKTMRD
jgi:glycosyltransferase involved in cell wall biosynthesis